MFTIFQPFPFQSMKNTPNRSLPVLAKTQEPPPSRSVPDSPLDPVNGLPRPKQPCLPKIRLNSHGFINFHPHVAWNKEEVLEILPCTQTSFFGMFRKWDRCFSHCRMMPKMKMKQQRPKTKRSVYFLNKSNHLYLRLILEAAKALKQRYVSKDPHLKSFCAVWNGSHRRRPCIALQTPGVVESPRAPRHRWHAMSW